MGDSELHRPVKIKAITNDPYPIEASPEERAALALRFGLRCVDQLEASVMLTPDGPVISASGTMTARWTQSCAVSGEDFAASHDEEITLRFIPGRTDWHPNDEVELTAEDCDELEYHGDSFDLGEAVAQSFGLAIDPYATGPAAGNARKIQNIQVEGEQDGPLAELLAGLKRD